MTRTRASARNAGTRHETTIARHLAATVDDRIERRARNGRADRGDISGLRTAGGQRLVVECKDTTRWDVAGWLRETELERGNDDALAGLVIAKRRGIANPGQQLVLMTLDNLIAILNGTRPEDQ